MERNKFVKLNCGHEFCKDCLKQTFIKCSYGKNKLRIIKDCVWNEILILKSNKIIDDLNIFKKYKIKIPKSDEILHIQTIVFDIIQTHVSDIILTNPSIVFLNLFDIPTNPKNIYIKLDIIEGFVDQGMSGSPVFDNKNNLVGILAKKNDLERSVYIIPIYILLKSLIKKDNENIYDVNIDEEIKKINNSKVINNFVLHKSLDAFIPISTYFMIEGDIKNDVKINNSKYSFINISNQLYINNSNKLLIDNNKIELTSRLIKLIKLYFSEITYDIYKILKENFKNKIYLYINVKRLVTKQDIKEFITNFNNKEISLKFTFGEVFLK
jgi:hypothetical protein